MFSFSHSDTLLSEEAKNWKKPKCPPAGERVHKLQYIHIMENYTETNTDELSKYQYQEYFKLKYWPQKKIEECFVEDI